jgi:hypothetical protein
VAEDVEKVNPDLIVRDKEGKPYSVRYEQVNAMLLNEFLKAHHKVEEEGATIARQQKQIDALTASLQTNHRRKWLITRRDGTLPNNSIRIAWKRVRIAPRPHRNRLQSRGLEFPPSDLTAR